MVEAFKRQMDRHVKASNGDTLKNIYRDVFI